MRVDCWSRKGKLILFAGMGKKTHVAQWLWRMAATSSFSASFNPCSRGCCSVALRDHGVPALLRKFQSLFSWMLLSGPGACKRNGRYSGCFNPCSRGCCSVAGHDGAGRRRGHPGFNPCSRGCCSVASTTTTITGLLYGFQSLFSWMLLSGSRPARVVCAWPAVSILVLVDVAQWLRRGHGAAGPVRVSILVLVDVAQWRGSGASGRGDTMRFQSLFSWMLLSGIWSKRRPTTPRSCFNPCSRGCCSVAAAPGQVKAHHRPGFNPCSRGCCSVASGSMPKRSKSHQVSILVLVDVAQWPPAAPATRSWRPCFNPCSRGCCSVARSSPLSRRPRPSFNPCSRGCCSVASQPGRIPLLADGVSILVLVDVAQWHGVRSRGTPSDSSFNPCSRGCCSVAPLLSGTNARLGGFNPCSRGCCSVAAGRRCALVAHGGVSILVLVDVAQWHRRRGRTLAAGLRFNPCSRGCCSVAWPWRWPVGYRRCVSILVLVDVAQWH